MTKPAQTFLLHYLAASEHTKREGRAWYPDARKFARHLSRQSGLTMRACAGIIAALSPRQHWDVNQRMAKLCVQGKRPRGLRRSVARSLEIRAGAAPLRVLRGLKTRAFYRAIAGDRDAVVIDSWMLRAIGHPGVRCTDKQYHEYAEILRRDAAYVGEHPADYQAIVWCHVRNRIHRR